MFHHSNPKQAVSTPFALTENRAAEKCGWSYATIRRRRADGSGPPYIQVGGKGKRVVYPTKELDAWIAYNLRNGKRDDCGVH